LRNAILITREVQKIYWVWERAETSEKLGEDRWPRITRNHKTTRQRINDGGEASKGICSMKYRYVEGKKKVHGGVVTDITFIAKRNRKVSLLWNFQAYPLDLLIMLN
jgi:hypothetical protein